MKKAIIKFTALLILITLTIIPLASCNNTPDIDYIRVRSHLKDVYGIGVLEDTYFVKMTVKDYGDIILKLDATAAPITVGNFIGLVGQGFYDGLTFHRAQEDFMIQGGDPDANGNGGSAYKIKGEFAANGFDNPIKHERGVISMARRGDSNNSASCQFFICNSDSYSVSSLDGQYAAFGKVIEGMDVVDAITAKMAPFGNSMGTVTDKTRHAVIEKITLLQNYEG